MQEYLTVKEVSRLLKIHPFHVYRLVRQKSIPALKIPGVGVRFDPEALGKWIQENSG